MTRSALTILISFFLIANTSLAQTRTFREVASQISRQVKPVIQNEQFVGYVVLDQLEKASKDSFNYKLTFLDENLNDIGTYSFRQCDLDLQQAVFEQDIFCLAYLGSNTPPGGGEKTLLGGKWKTKPKTHIYAQFFDLQGKLVNEVYQPVDAIIPEVGTYMGGNTMSTIGTLKNMLRVTTITGKGFAFVYGDGDVEFPVSTPGTFQLSKKKESPSNEHIMIYDLQGNRKWRRILPSAKSLALNLTGSGDYLYILRKCYGKIPEGDYELLTYQFNDSSKVQKKSLVDGGGNPLRVLGFKKHLTGQSAFLAGLIVNKSFKSRVAVQYQTLDYSVLTNGFYAGTFHLELAGETPVEHYGYWIDESMEPVISKKGCVESINAYGCYTCCFDDFSGNIYFAGASISKKQRVTDFVPVLKQDASSGKLSYHSSCNMDRASLERSFLAVADEERQTNYLVIEDAKKIDIYDVNTSKVMKTIKRDPGSGISLEVFKAKSGHIMISEKNSKERTVKLSIEAI